MVGRAGMTQNCCCDEFMEPTSDGAILARGYHVSKLSPAYLTVKARTTSSVYERTLRTNQMFPTSYNLHDLFT